MYCRNRSFCRLSVVHGTKLCLCLRVLVWHASEIHCIFFVFFCVFPIFIRGRHLKLSVANWKNRPTPFDLLRKVVQGQFFLGHLLTPRWVRQKPNLGSRVMGTWRNRHPGSGLIPARCLWFQSSSSEILREYHRIWCFSGPPLWSKIDPKIVDLEWPS